MRLADPFSLKFAKPKQAVLFSAHERTNGMQSSFFLNFNDECFAVAEGLAHLPHPDVSAKLACETAIWGYKLVRQRPFYWSDKKLFIQRIFRSTNISLWQKQREHGFSAGLGCSLVVVIVGDKNFWAGGVGDGGVWMLRAKGVLSRIIWQETKTPVAYVGQKRYGIKAQFASGKFSPGDTLLLGSSSLTHVESPTMLQLLSQAGASTESMGKTAVALVQDSLRKTSGAQSAAALVVKRVSLV